MSTVINVEKKEDSTIKKVLEKAYEHRRSILIGAAAGTLYYLGFKSGWNACDKRCSEMLDAAMPKIVDRYGKTGAFAFYDWMTDKVPEAAKLCDAFIDANPNAETVRDYFIKLIRNK